MKKIINILGSISLTYAATGLAISCNIGSTDGNNYLSNLPNFDWSNSDYGDGIDFNNSNSQNILDNIGSQTLLGAVTPNNSGSYLDYSKFNTGFQWTQNIKKQAVTGVPLNEGFMPNGNYASDFGITSAARKYLRMNSILDWNPNSDNDAKYNKSVIALQPREFVATSNPNQDSRINYNQIGFSTRNHRTFDNTIVGTKNPFENTMLNWQYVNNYINWSGSWFEGPIVPPAADVIDQAHINGAPVFGTVFLDGYHGLTKEMLKDFLAQNSDGTYKIVNILINIAKYNGFDGWFINNEANGSMPNGTILDYNVMYEIIKEFNNKVGSATNPIINHLKLIFYRNSASVAKSLSGYYDDPETLKMTQSGYVKPNGKVNPTDIQLDFGQTSDQTIDFLKEHHNYSGQNLNTMISQGSSANFYGSYDFQQLAYQESFPQGKPKYNKENYTGFSTFLDNGSATFGNYAYDWVQNKGVNKQRAYLFATQVTNLFNTIQFSGTNTFLSNDDVGMQSNKTIDDYKGLQTDSYQQAAFNSDPRIKVDNKGSQNKFVENNIYNYWKNNKRYNSSSYGIGDVAKERTTLFDDHQILNKATNFSMGSGIKFVNRDKNGNAVIANDYPWTNRRLSDILPTYQWKIYDHNNSNQALAIDKISGFYDYDTVYQKGNSIAIGGGINKEGQVENATWDLSKTYDWDIMGTNLINSNHNISFIYHDGSAHNSNSDVKFLVTKTNQDSFNSSQSLFTPEKEELKDGWVKISLNLNRLAVDEKNRISKIGLQIKPHTESFKFNVGQFNVNTPPTNLVDANKKSEISNLISEYMIKRMVKNKALYNIRFQWKDMNFKNISYYAIYYFNNDKWYRIGETNQNNYFLRDLGATNKNIKLMIKPVYNNNISQDSFIFNILAN